MNLRESGVEDMEELEGESQGKKWYKYSSIM